MVKKNFFFEKINFDFFFSFTTDREIYVRGFGIYGIIPVVKTHLGITEEKTNHTDWNCQVEMQVRFNW